MEYLFLLKAGPNATGHFCYYPVDRTSITILS